MLLSHRLRKIRRAQDLTQQELAEQAGVSYVTISRIESGEASQVYVETVMRLAKALDVTTDALLGMDEFEITDKEPDHGGSSRAHQQAAPWVLSCLWGEPPARLGCALCWKDEAPHRRGASR